MSQFSKKSKGATAAVIVGVVAFYFAFNQGPAPTPTPIVSIDDGQLQGQTAVSRAGKEYMQFVGIPFAEPPVGELRFESPVPLRRPWTGVKQVVKYPPYCAQSDGFLAGKVQGQEDCLYMNVYTYDVTPDKKKPVLVYIHGGAFLQGSSGSHYPTFFMDHDIVLVTMNYRLGPLGFINTGDDLIRGNMGLKDQNLALRWVKRNIAKFGGDVSNIFLFGTSAGAVSVHYHMISPQSQGLFHKALAQSGVTTCPWGYDRNPKEVLLNYVKSLDCPSGNMSELVQCLKKIDAIELVRHQSSAMIPVNDMMIFVPSLETVIRDDTFLAEDPYDILKSGKFAKVPFMLGVTSGEGGLRTARFDAMPEYIPEIDKRWEQTGHVALVYDDLKGNTKALRDIRSLYFGNSSFGDDLHEFKKKFSELNSDVMFFEPTHTVALHHAKTGVPTYLYYYTYDPIGMPNIYGVLKAVRPDDWIFADLKLIWTIVASLVRRKLLGVREADSGFGTAHGSDLLQTWDVEGAGSLLGKDIEFSRNLVKLIVDFARNEEPLQFNGVVWPPIQIKDEANPSFKYMVLDETSKIIDEPFAQNMPFWMSIRNNRTVNVKEK